MHRVLERQIKQASRDAADPSIVLARLLTLVAQSYGEYDRDRERNDRASRLMDEEQQERANALALAKEDAETANRMKSEFLGTMSHELRTPLNAILGFAEIIRDRSVGDANPDAYCDYASHIHSSGSHLLSLINQILDLSRIEAGAYDLDREAIDLYSVIRSCCEMVSPGAKKRGLTLSLNCESALPQVLGDARALRQVMLNILSNALKFTETGSVSVELWGELNRVWVEVQDTGVGIAPEYIERIFDPFRRGDPKICRKFEGAGLGLPISKRLVDAQGGEIAISSEPGCGAKVIISFPAITETLTPPDPAIATEDSLRRCGRSVVHRRVVA